MKKTKARKFFSNVGAFLAFVGFFLLLGAVGGAECDLCTSAEFWCIGGTAIAMMVGGVLMYNAGEDENNNG